MWNRTVLTAGLAAVAGIFATLIYWQVDIINRGGPVMIPIVMCSVFSVALILERCLYFMSLHLGEGTAGRFEELRGAIETQRWSEAQTVCEHWRGPVGRVALAGMAARERTSQEIDQAMEETAHDELPFVERHLRWLSTLAQVSTLLGLLGTVVGLVVAFQAIQTKTTGGNPVSPGDLAGGVWQALITTVAGLTVAIPTILAYNYLASRVTEVQFQMEKVSDLIAHWRRRSGRSHHPA